MGNNISYPYQGLQEYPVKNKVNLFQTGLQELTTARNIMNQTRRILGVSDQDTFVSVLGENSEAIKLTFNKGRMLVAEIYYVPGLRRLDIYDAGGIIVAYEKHKCIYHRCTETLIKFGFLKMFDKIVAFT